MINNPKCSDCDDIYRNKNYTYENLEKKTYNLFNDLVNDFIHDLNLLYQTL